jgi:hypothetical protein
MSAPTFTETPAKACAINPRLQRRIVTEYVNPPIPARAWDWRATFENYEPGDSIGTGKTEQEAIDWLVAEEAHLIASEHNKAEGRPE